MNDSRLPGLFRLSVAERLSKLEAAGFLRAGDAELLRSGEPLLGIRTADKMIENVVGVFGLPMAIATNFRVNGSDCIVPMVVEEPSIVAGVSGAAKLMRAGRGIDSVADEPLLIGQIALSPVADGKVIAARLEAAKDDLLQTANRMQPRLCERGGGAREIECHVHRLESGDELVVLHVLVDTRDAMGANLVNSICEGLAADVERISGSKTGLQILSNLADRALVRSEVTVQTDQLGVGEFSGEVVRDGIVAASEFANTDPYRATTHNKGILNGIDAVALATGNDWRSIEAGAHAYASLSGRYAALSSWQVDGSGNLQGRLTIPLKVGTVGGSLLSNPGAALGLRIAAAESAKQLAELMGATGLAQNFAALRAMASNGIQSGHMRLHARSVAASVHTPPEHFDAVVDGMISSGDIKDWKARELLESLESRQSKPTQVDAAVSAAAKIILLGEHAAVYGKHVLAVPIPMAMTARATGAGRGVHLRIPAWHIDRIYDTDGDSDDGAAAIVSTAMAELGIGENGCTIDVTANVPPGAGLGSSATLATVIVRALDECFTLGVDDDNVNRIVFECEKRIHGDPSGVDNTLAVYGKPVLFRKGDAAGSNRIELPRPLPLVVGISSTRGNTREQVEKVRTGYEMNRNLYARVFDQIDRLSVAGSNALQKDDYESLGAMMNVCHGLLNAIQVSTPELERMVDIARRGGALGAKLTGAGGGGAVVALCPGIEEDVTSAWRAAGYDVFDTGL